MHDTQLSGPGRISRVLLCVEEDFLLGLEVDEVDEVDEIDEIVDVVEVVAIIIDLDSEEYTAPSSAAAKPKQAVAVVITIFPDLSPDINRPGANGEEVIAEISFEWVECSSINKPVNAFQMHILRSLPPEANRKSVDGCCEKDTAVTLAPRLWEWR